MADDRDVLHADLCELLAILGMGDHARPQSPHEVFQEALAVLRERLSAVATGSPKERLNTALLAQCDSPRICSVGGRVKEGIVCGPCERKLLQVLFARDPTARSGTSDAALQEPDWGLVYGGGTET